MSLCSVHAYIHIRILTSRSYCLYTVKWCKKLAIVIDKGRQVMVVLEGVPSVSNSDNI
jgi:hypothetical protein